MASKHDAHARPPDNLRRLYKEWQKRPIDNLSSENGVLDTAALACHESVLEVPLCPELLAAFAKAFKNFAPSYAASTPSTIQAQCYEIKALPGGSHPCKSSMLISDTGRSISLPMSVSANCSGRVA